VQGGFPSGKSETGETQKEGRHLPAPKTHLLFELIDVPRKNSPPITWKEKSRRDLDETRITGGHREGDRGRNRNGNYDGIDERERKFLPNGKNQQMVQRYHGTAAARPF